MTHQNFKSRIKRKATLGISYSSLVQVDDDDKDSGDIVQVQIEGPDWLAYDPVNKLVKGTPLTTGSFEYTVIATDLFGASVSKTNQINVSDEFFSIDSFELVSLKQNLAFPSLAHGLQLPLAIMKII